MTQLEVIKKFVESIKNHDYSPTYGTQKTDDANFDLTKSMMDEAIRTCSHYNGIEEAIKEFLSQAKNSPDSDTFLLNVCGINVYNSDTGGIAGYDTGISKIERTSDSTVWKIGNTYTAKNSEAQNINTGSHGWIINATDYNDTINSGGEDIIYAGKGDDLINIDGRTAKIITGGNSDTISVGADVKTFTVKDFNDNLKIIGAKKFDSVENYDDSITFTRKGFDSVISAGSYLENNTTTSSDDVDLEVDDAINISLSKVDTIKGYFSANGTFTSGKNSKNAAGNVTSEFDSSFLDVASDGTLSFIVNGLKLNIVGERDPETKKIINKITYDNIDELKTTPVTIKQVDETGKFVDVEITKTYQFVTIANLYKWWLKESVNLNEMTQGIGFTSDGVGVNEIDLYFENYTEKDWLAYVFGGNVDSSGKTRYMEVVVNEKFFANVTNEDDPNGMTYYYNQDGSKGGDQLDRTIAHEFNHGLFNSNVNYFDIMPLFITEGMAELVHGVDDKRLEAMRELLEDYVNNSDGTYLEDFTDITILNANQIETIKGGDQKGIYPYAGGYMFLRWLAKTASDASKEESAFLPSDELSANVNLSEDGYYYISGKSSKIENAKISQNEDETKYLVGVADNNAYTLNRAVKQNVTYNGDAWYIKDVNTHDTITADNGKSNDTIIGIGGHNLINSADGNDVIDISGQFSTIYAGAGNDSIYNVAAYNYVEAGDGKNSVQMNGSQGSTIISGSGDDYLFGAKKPFEKEDGKTDDIVVPSSYQYISLKGGNNLIDYLTGESSTIISGSGNDSIYFFDEYAKSNFVSLTGGKNYVSLTGANNTIISGKGNDSVIFTNYEDSIVSNDSGNNLNLGDGDNLIYIYSFANTVKAGSGNDTVALNYTKSSLNAVDMGDGDNFFYVGGGSDNTIIGGSDSDTFETYNDEESQFTLKNLDYSDVITLSSAIDSIEVDEENNSMILGDLTIILPDADIDLIQSFSLSDDGLLITSNYEEYIGTTVKNKKSNKIIRGTGKDDTIVNSGNNVTIDAGEGYDKVINSGDYVSITGGQGKEQITNTGDYAIITTGTGKDTIESSGNYATIDGGKGKNFISLGKSSESNLIFYSGKTTVENFHQGFNESSDQIYIEGDFPAVDFKDDGLTFYTDETTENETDNENENENTEGENKEVVEKSLTLKDVNETAKIIFHYENGDINPYVFIADDEIYKIIDDEAKYYVGATSDKTHGISFEGVAKDIDVTLNTDYTADADFYINNIHSIIGGNANSQITGSDEDDTIKGGSGTNLLIGRAGDDVLISGGKTGYYFSAESGQDTIKNFSSANDEILVDDSIKKVTLNGNDVVVTANYENYEESSSGSYKFTVENMAGKNIKINVGGQDFVARVSKKLIYDSDVNYYNATAGNATIIAETGSSNVNIWLNQKVGEKFGNKTQIVGDIKYISAEKAKGSNVLAGSNDINNVIIAGNGFNSLWGGGKSDDSLIAGSGVDTFFYVKGDGKDTVKGASSEDIVDLGNIKMSDISSIKVEDNSVLLDFKKGGSLYLDTNSETNFNLQGSTYFYNKSVEQWQKK